MLFLFTDSYAAFKKQQFLPLVLGVAPGKSHLPEIIQHADNAQNKNNFYQQEILMSGKHFDKAAAGWDQKQRRVELAAKIASAISSTLPLHKKMTGLEYGCGTGLVGLALAPELATLTAVDTSNGMLEVLAGKIKEEKISNVTPLCLDLLQEPLNERFDLIFCAMTLHHIKEADQLLARFCELLAAGGYLAVADLQAEDGSFHDAEADGIMHHGFHPEDLVKTLTDLGLTQVSVKEVHSIIKTNDAGVERAYPVFLLSGKKV